MVTRLVTAMAHPVMAHPVMAMVMVAPAVRNCATAHARI
jgi:hypothetical protein